MAEYIIQEGIERRYLTDDEVCERLPHHIVFSASAAQVKADGSTPVTIRLQLSSLPLSDDTRRPIHRSRVVNLVAEGEAPFSVTLDDKGYAEFECSFAAVGTYRITTDGVIYSDGITIEGI